MQQVEEAKAAHTETEKQLIQSQKLEAVGQLTGGIAHDFNNLLTVILGSNELLLSDATNEKRVKELAGMTITAAERGADLTMRLLAFSKKQALEPRVVNIGEQLDSSLHPILLRTLPETVELDISVADDLWLVEVDPSQLESALLNLVINARDALGDGGKITITVENASSPHEIQQNNDISELGDYVAIRVSDDGHGMADDTLARVFDPFFTTKEVGEGSGLGLSMVYGFVKQSGGHIRIHSWMHEGTSVVLYFPRSTRERMVANLGNSGEQLSHGEGTILLVEDDRLVKQAARENLIEMGYEVLEAENGREALEILRSDTDLDLLMTDVVLPERINGRMLATLALELRKDLKVLFTSGYPDDVFADDEDFDPKICLLKKPYTRVQLAQKLHSTLSNAQKP